MRDSERDRKKPGPEDSAAAKTVRTIFNMAAEGMGCKEIAKGLNRQGIKTATGERWGRVTVHKVVTNEGYCGTLVGSVTRDAQTF
jgi:hypothetical protein